MKKYRDFLQRLFLWTAMTLVLAVLLFSMSQLIRCLRQREDRQQTHDKIAALAVQTAPPAAPDPLQESTEIQTPEQARGELPPIPITVDHALLKEENEDIIAWICCPDTPIDYPVVQGEDDRYYLDHMIDGRENPYGSIFLDHRCKADLSDSYNVIYGHNLRDSAMFGSLPSYADQTYYESHPFVFLLTPDGNYAMEIFAAFVTDSDDGIFTVPPTERTRQKLIENCIQRSDITTQVQPTAEDRLVILSTCSYAYEDARYVLAGILRGY